MQRRLSLQGPFSEFLGTRTERLVWETSKSTTDNAKYTKVTVIVNEWTTKLHDVPSEHPAIEIPSEADALTALSRKETDESDGSWLGSDQGAVVIQCDFVLRKH